MVLGLLSNFGDGMQGLLNDPNKLSMLQLGADLMAQGAAGASTGGGLGTALSNFANNARESRLNAMREQMFQMKQMQMQQQMQAQQAEMERQRQGYFGGNSIEAQQLNAIVMDELQRGATPEQAQRAAIDRYNQSKATTTLNAAGLPVTYARQAIFGNQQPYQPAQPTSQQSQQFMQPPVPTGQPAQPMTPQQQAGVQDIMGLLAGGNPMPEQRPAAELQAELQPLDFGQQVAPQLPVPEFNPLDPIASQAARQQAMSENIKLQAEMAKQNMPKKINPADFKEGEKLAAGFALRMNEISPLIDTIEASNIDSAKTFSFTPTALMTPEEQQYKQAANDWIRAKLRKESGAVIGDEEMKTEYETYFPVIGDSEKVIEQKRKARKTAERAMRGIAGQAYDYLIKNTQPEQQSSIKFLGFE